MWLLVSFKGYRGEGKKTVLKFFLKITTFLLF